MAFSETTILSTREPVYGNRRLGQVLAVPSGRLDKVSLYLEPKVGSQSAADLVDVVAEIYIVDSFRIPVGSPIAYDSMPLSSITSRGLVNFRIETDCPSVVAVVLKTTGGDLDNHVAWRYAATSSAGEELLASEDGGATWTQDTSRKFSFIAYSLLSNAVSEDDQSAEVQGGTPLDLTDDSQAEFELADLDRAVVEGDTVLIKFGDIVATLVVDHSGSMTWNDNEGLRLDFLRAYIDDLESILPPGTEARYSIVKFNSRQIGSLDIFVQQEETGSLIEGVRIVRKIGSPPTGPSDGIVVFEGLVTALEDSDLTEGTSYHYAAFTYDGSGNFSEARRDSIIPQSPPAPPMGVASLALKEKVVLYLGKDVGKREVEVSWVNPSGYDYDQVTVVRRVDRFPEWEEDGTSFSMSPLTLSFTDFDAGSLDPEDHPINGMTYYYSIFTEDTASGLKSYRSNTRKASIGASLVDRTWELAEPPFDVPPAGFDDTLPAPPANATVANGNGEIVVSWDAGDAKSRRYRIFYDETESPKPQNLSGGAREYSGELVYDGTETTFAHRNLENNQPHFYVLVSMDVVGNQSSGVALEGRPFADASDSISPAPVSNFSAEVVSSSRARLEWDLDISRQDSVQAYFGDVVRLTTNLTYVDANPRRTSSTLEFVEDLREISVFDEDGNSSADDADAPAVNAATAMLFDQAPTSDSNVLVASLSMTPFISILNRISSARLETYSSLNVKDKSDGHVLTEVRSKPVNVTMLNPFSLAIKNDPPQFVLARKWNQACDLDNVPKYDVDSVPGVLARSGDPFIVMVEAGWRGASLADDIDLFVRILDKETGEVSSRIRLPETRNDGIALYRTRTEPDEILDRRGEPTGETVDRNVVRLTLPPQDIPGEFTIEVTGSYEGYRRTASMDVSYASSLNVDVKAKPFVPNGANVAEQEAFVYVGGFSSGDPKTPAPDQTVTTWELSKISGGGPDTRPLFSRDGVPGTGVKAVTRGGIARNVFMGPGTDVEPPATPSCTEGELYQIKVSATALGMRGEGYATVELTPFETTDNKRIFLRLAKQQKDEFGVPFDTGELARRTTYADGSHESAWEILADPSLDTETGDRSGSAFRDSLVGMGGLVPILKDGTVVSISVVPISNLGYSSDVAIRTDLNPGGKPSTAKATIINGKALFYLKSNLLVDGEILDRPLDSELSTQIYSSAAIMWHPSPRVYAIRAHVILEINGHPVVFSGGGGSVEEDALPAFLSLLEPLSTTPPTGG